MKSREELRHSRFLGTRAWMWDLSGSIIRSKPVREVVGERTGGLVGGSAKPESSFTFGPSPNQLGVLGQHAALSDDP